MRQNVDNGFLLFFIKLVVFSFYNMWKNNYVNENNKISNDLLKVFTRVQYDYFF